MTSIVLIVENWFENNSQLAPLISHLPYSSYLPTLFLSLKQIAQVVEGSNSKGTACRTTSRSERTLIGRERYRETGDMCVQHTGRAEQTRENWGMYFHRVAYISISAPRRQWNSSTLCPSCGAPASRIFQRDDTPRHANVTLRSGQ